MTQLVDTAKRLLNEDYIAEIVEKKLEDLQSSKEAELYLCVGEGELLFDKPQDETPDVVRIWKVTWKSYSRDIRKAKEACAIQPVVYRKHKAIQLHDYEIVEYLVKRQYVKRLIEVIGKKLFEI